MSRDYTKLPFTQVRRKDRAIEEETWIIEFLREAPIGTLAMVWEGQPFINSNLFVLDEAGRAIYMHTAREGRTRSIIEKNPRVCFSISDMGRLLPADVALEFSVEYRGVSAFGKAFIIEEEKEAARGLQLLLDKYFPHLEPGKDYRPIIPEELNRTSIFRIDIDQWGGKQKKVEEDFPGAFYYKDLSGLK